MAAHARTGDARGDPGPGGDPGHRRAGVHLIRRTRRIGPVPQRKARGSAVRHVTEDAGLPVDRGVAVAHRRTVAEIVRPSGDCCRELRITGRGRGQNDCRGKQKGLLHVIGHSCSAARTAPARRY